MTVDSVERQFIVVKPSGQAPPEGYPVVFMLHGSSGDGEKFYNISGWKEKGEEEKIITVFPSSLEWCIIDSGKQKRTTKWVNGDLMMVACPGQNLKDDVKFFRMMVDTITKIFNVNERKVYLSGFSNGGVMAMKLAVEASDIFAAIAASAGTLVELDSGMAKRMIPLVFTVGTMDDRYYTAMGLPELPFNDSTLFRFGATFNRILNIFGLSQTFTKDSTALTLHYRFNTLAATAAWEFDFVLFNDLTHEYPNGTNYPLTAANLFWQFFQQFSLPAEVKADEVSLDNVVLWPNPAQRFVTIEAEDATHFVLRSLLGEPIVEVSAYPDKRIDLPNLSAGMYFAEITTSHGIVHRKLLIE
jgi:polyhydroxybutyrate depolymerase